MKQAAIVHAADIYREEYALLEEMREALTDASLTPEAVRERARALAEVYDILLRKTVKITGISDKTQRKLLEANQRIEEQQAELQERHQELALLNHVSQMFSSTIDFDSVLTAVLNEMHEHLEILATSFWLRDAATGELVCKESIGPGRDNILGWRLPMGQGIVGQAAQSGNVIMVGDTRATNQHYKEVDAKTGIEIRSILSLPFRSRGEVIGVLNLVDANAHRFTQTDLCLVEPIAAAAASAVENARLYQLAQQEIAERIRTEEAMRQAKEAAELANRAKSIFLSNMSHELRAPLNAILGFARILAREPDIIETVSYARTIVRSGEHLLSLINQVLDLSKIEAGRSTLDLKECDLFLVLDDLEEMFALKAEQKRLLFRLERAAGVPQHIRADETKLRQILINLVSNAIKFTQRGSVTARVINIPLQEGERSGVLETGHLSTSNTQEGNLIRLAFEIEDTGPGIAPEELPLLFEAFTQTTAGRLAQEGSGLGLAISRQFARLMGGDLTVSSVVGVGSIFTMALPVEWLEKRAVIPCQPSRLKRILVPKPDQPIYRLLIVDDKPENRQLLLALLKPFAVAAPSGQGLELREASNGQEALTIWREWHPHLIWMDIRMPVLDGYLATKEIKASPQGKETKVIVLSSSILDDERVAILAEGGDDFLRKPFQEADIFAVLERHLGVRFLQVEDAAVPDSQAIAAAIANIPAALRDDLAWATERFDIALILQVIDALRTDHQTAADYLECLAQNFDYEQMLTCLREERNA